MNIIELGIMMDMHCGNEDDCFGIFEVFYFILCVRMARNNIIIKIRYKKAPVNPIYTDSEISDLIQ